MTIASWSTLLDATPAVVATVVAVTLGVASANKLADFGAFRTAIANYAVVPQTVAFPTAGAVVLSEVAITIALVTPPTRRTGLVLAAVLLVAFSTAIAVNLAVGQRDVGCGCFGGESNRALDLPALLRPLALGTASAVAVIVTQTVDARAPGAVDQVLSVVGVAAVVSGIAIARLRAFSQSGQKTKRIQRGGMNDWRLG